MNTWIMSLNIIRDDNETFLERLIEKNIGDVIEFSKSDNTKNVEKIEKGDIVYLRYGGTSNQQTNNVVRGVYAILERKGYDESKKLTSFIIKACYGIKDQTINSTKFYTTLLPHSLFSDKFKEEFHGLLASSGKNSVSFEKNSNFVDGFLEELKSVKSQVTDIIN